MTMSSLLSGWQRLFVVVPNLPVTVEHEPLPRDQPAHVVLARGGSPVF